MAFFYPQSQLRNSVCFPWMTLMLPILISCPHSNSSARVPPSGHIGHQASNWEIGTLWDSLCGQQKSWSVCSLYYQALDVQGKLIVLQSGRAGKDMSMKILMARAVTLSILWVTIFLDCILPIFKDQNQYRIIYYANVKMAAIIFANYFGTILQLTKLNHYIPSHKCFAAPFVCKRICKSKQLNRRATFPNGCLPHMDGDYGSLARCNGEADTVCHLVDI